MSIPWLRPAQTNSRRMLMAGIALLITGLGCRGVGLLDAASIEPSPTPETSAAAQLPLPTNVGLENTVTAMKATVAALELQQSRPTVRSTPQILIVTATATSTPVFVPPPILTATPTPLPPSATPVSPQSRTIVVVVTPTTPPTSTPYPEAPVTIAPFEGTTVSNRYDQMLLQWSWNGLLGPNEFFEVKLRPDGQSRAAYIGQERSTGHDLKLEQLAGGRYHWTVQIVSGYFINDSGHPDDWVFESFRGPESEPRLIIVDGYRSDDDDDNRRHDHDDDDDDDEDTIL